MISVEDLWKSYDAVEALRGVNFNIGSGEIVGLLGPNGAGKTTIMKILTGYLQPDRGEVEVDGLDVLKEPRSAQARIGYLPENAPLYPEPLVQDYLRMIADLRQIPEDEVRDRIAQAVFATGLETQLTRPIGHLSKGLRQRVGLAQAILHRPKIMILDEPTIGLDPTQVVEVRKLIRDLAADSTVLFSTHILSEVEALCDRVIILINGVVRADSRLSELASTADAVVIMDEEAPGAAQEIKDIQGVRAVEQGQTEEGYPMLRVLGLEEGGGAELCPAIYRLAADKGWPVREIRRDQRSLETVFNELATAE
jgi:ABC-2 type transport system ATP-binding protein